MTIPHDAPAATAAPRSTKRADKQRSMDEALLDSATEMVRQGVPEALTIAGLA